MSFKKSALLFVCCVVSITVGYLAVSAILFARNADEMRLRAMVPEVELEPSSVFSRAHDEDIMRLYNDVGRSVEWSDADRDWVLNTIGSGWPDVEVDPNGDMYEAWQLLNITLTIIGERIGNGIQTDESVVSAYRETVLGMLDHPQGRLRQKGATAVAQSGMISDPAIRSVLERMAESDPDPGARRAAGIKLRQYAGIETEQDDCPTCPKGDAP